MEVIYPGHKYHLSNLKSDGVQVLQFRQEGLHPEVEGTSCQEVIRALIDRVQVLNNEIPWSGNEDIVSHLRQSLAGFEARALLRKVEKGKLDIETLPTGKDGHIEVKQ